ncbi:hypothetical protein PRIPAC_87743 [Pristionchus pacificus]|uniref:Uncharacterized protein n=1 Tax=Pristionchus pacificus TaxID=54126 RepID=A0A2A6CY31_PRIPA|nr:hypothetical protein PRIPAC_87743 [Pristionchus pacificus]|eukprot:PDM82996.1 hypothetical protein PRIPAC_37389 [Pristionchus pacificus]
MDSLSSQLGGLSLRTTSSTIPSTPAVSSPRMLGYLLGKTEKHACVLHWSSGKPFTMKIASIPATFEAGKLYPFQGPADKTVFSDISEDSKKYYYCRGDISFTETGYRRRVLRGLLLGSRIRDHEQECSTVTSRSPLVISMPSRRGRIDLAWFRTEAGELFKVVVDNVKRDADSKKMTLFCTAATLLPSGLLKNSRLIHEETDQRTPIVTSVLDDFVMERRPIVTYSLLNRIYGDRGFASSTPPRDRTLVQIRKSKGDGIMLNVEQSQAVRYHTSDVYPALVIEAPPGSGKTLTAAAMALQRVGGLQLFLSTANVPVYNMAMALSDIDYGDLKIVHLESKEAAEKNRSPFAFELLTASDRALISLLELQLERARSLEKRELIDKIRQVKDDALYRSGGCDVIFGTVDKILMKLISPGGNRPCPIQRQLETAVTRIVIDEASQLTEAALNAIHLCFPTAKLVLIGDSKQLPPFRSEEGDVASKLAARSALDVLKRRSNVPVITLRQVYRAAPSAMAHYSDVFYGGALVSGKPESSRVKLSSIIKVATSCTFMEVVGSKAESFGTSRQNDKEIAALVWTINKLRLAGYDHESVMVISYYAAQQKLAKNSIPPAYEVLTVDSAQGREKDIVIVLTTVDTEAAPDFLKSPLRCNVAVSRHKEALIVLGHAALCKIEPWNMVLDNKYFTHVSLS